MDGHVSCVGREGRRMPGHTVRGKGGIERHDDDEDKNKQINKI